MQITEVIIFTRANTDISWSINFPADPNDPFISNLDKTYTVSIDVSEDQLTKTTTRVWTDQQAFIDCHTYSNNTLEIDHFTTLSTPGITYNRTITSVA